MKKLYLAHNFTLRKNIRKWELRMESKYGIVLDNPFYDNPHRTKEMVVIDKFKDESKEQQAYLATRDKDSIVDDDLEKIRKSDGIVAFANDTRIGTPMEIFFASKVLGIPVYVITKKYSGHPWIRKYATQIFKNKTEFEKFVKEKYGLRTGL